MENSYSEESVNSFERKHCRHGECNLLRSFSTANPGRRFWRCRFGNLPGDCKYFVWYDEPFDGRAKAALLHCIRKSNVLVEKEQKVAAEKLQELKDDLEFKMHKYRVENRSLKKSLKETKCRLHSLCCVLIVTYVFMMLWILGGRVEFVSNTRRRLPM
ncbi:uncharacterized protein LOC130985501 [Salvia miltiorrhiza]|uniref:uncharacterized protein LOC130985501 n=1 Tax=Salvia miltiorrhiza TaxID=226208 RepID=UPI0025AD0917|nr:uncharacterized protein LOC130985501 [Salvia miltiorrhiza]